MSKRPLLLDLFCKAGGCSVGYSRAGFDVVGVDIEHQPRYPFMFLEDDALDVLRVLISGEPYAGYYLNDFDAIHASPPCQAHTKAQKIRGRDHADYIEPVRDLLRAIGLPYVIENVPGAPLVNPFELCGAMFGLGVYRHRLFETNFPVAVRPHSHDKRQTKMGRPPVDGEMMQVVGNFSGVNEARAAMGIDWMTRDELSQAIPPAFTEYIGKQLIRVCQRELSEAV